MKLDSKYWNNRYEQFDTGWDVGSITPPLEEYFSSFKMFNSQILVIGAGNGYEVEYLHNNNFLNETKEIIGVNSVKRFDLSSKIMVARLQSYALYEIESDYTFFCDADCVFINKLSLPNIEDINIFLSPLRYFI